MISQTEDFNRDFTRGWNAALDAVIEHCDDVRRDRAENPPAFPMGHRKFKPEDIVLFERATASSIKCRIESLRMIQPSDPIKERK